MPVPASGPQQPADSDAIPTLFLSLISPRTQDNLNEHALPITAEVSCTSDDHEVLATSSQPSSAGRAHGAGLRCNHSGCKYEGDFPRQWELQRHIVSKHMSEKPFWCPIVGCIKGRVAPAFARPDKLTQHVRAVHHRGDARAVCPSGGCADMPLELDILGVHIKLQHLSSKNKPEGVSGKFLRAMINAVSTDRRNCPLWFCRKRVELDEFPVHLLTHTCEELGASADELAQEGYTLSKLGCVHGEDNLDTVNPCHCKVTAVELSCPMCASRHWNRQSLKIHIEEVHVWSGEDLTTFRQRILALVGMEAAQILDGRVWSDVACPLRLNYRTEGGTENVLHECFTGIRRARRLFSR